MEKPHIHPIENIPEPSLEPLTPKEKELLVRAWVGPVTNTKPIEDIETATNEDVKEWMSTSIEEGIATFAEEIDLHPNEQLLQNIQSALSVSEKAAAEKLYLADVFQKLTDAKNRSKENNPSRETRWDSWPTIMQENKTWNCVGAAILGSHLLQQSGIERFHGWPPGHILNIVQLIDKTWWYVDFNNNTFFEIHPSETQIEGVRTLIIQDPRTNYELIPLFPESDISAAILGNLSSMRFEASDETKQGAGKQSAVHQMERYATEFTSAPFNTARRKLFPYVEKLNNSKEEEQERKRLEEVEKKEKEHRKICEPYTQLIADFTASFNEQTLERVLEEARRARQDIELIFMNENLPEAIAQLPQTTLGDELKEIIRIRLAQLQTLKETGQLETYSILLAETFKKWRRI